MSTLGVIGCILGVLIVIYLCYKDWSVYLATFAGACVVIACNTLPFIDSLVGDYVSGMFTAVKSFFFMILFGCLQSKIYTESGAAYTIADTVMNHLLKENMSNTGKNLVAIMIKGAGYDVVDLGVNCDVSKYDEAVAQGASVIACSSLLTTTMSYMKDVVDHFKGKGVKVIIGGAPVTQSYCKEIGADGYSEDANGAVKLLDTLFA